MIKNFDPNSPWLTIKVGERQWTLLEVIKEIREAAGYREAILPEELLSRGEWFRWSNKKKSIPLFIKTTEELGFGQRYVTCQEVAHLLEEEGFKLCPRETAFQILLQHPVSNRERTVELKIVSSPIDLKHLQRPGDNSKRIDDFYSDTLDTYYRESFCFDVSLGLHDNILLKRSVYGLGGDSIFEQYSYPPYTKWVFSY